MNYTGVIVEESLKSQKILKDFKIIKTEVSEDETWHMHTVCATKEQLEKLSQELNSGTWYAHFWNENDIVVVFQNKIFAFQKGASKFFREEVRILGVRSVNVQKIEKGIYIKSRGFSKKDLYGLCEQLLSSGYLEEGSIGL